jgi:hypothetical protein
MMTDKEDTFTRIRRQMDEAADYIDLDVHAARITAVVAAKTAAQQLKRPPDDVDSSD